MDNIKKRVFTSEPDPKYISTDWRKKKLRVAAYIRVSTDSADQENSLKNQRAHYEKMIPANPLWEYVGIFADEGFSGTSMHNRKGLRRLINECSFGNVDLIVVKEVSRLARNTKECLDVVEFLASLNSPVGIFFENNNLNTLETGSKIFLTVLAMCAELESELKSRSVAFGLAVLYSQFKFPVPTMLGYKKTDKYTMEIEPEGAKTVRAIYALFLAGWLPQEIAELFTKLERSTAKGRITWRSSSIIGILSNEKYAGSYLMQKSFRISFLKKQTRQNKGQKRMYHDPEHHTPIISLREHARALLLLHSNQNSPYFNRKYEVKLIQKGLLSGFIPMNVAFGGYSVEHYLAAYVMSRVKEIKFSTKIPIIPGVCRVGREQYCDRYTPSITMMNGKLTVNKACKDLLDAQKVEILLNPRERLLAIRKTSPENKNSIPWTTNHIPARELNDVLFQLMGWQRDLQYKVPATVLRRGKDRVIIFDLSEYEYRFREEGSMDFRKAVPREWVDSLGLDSVDYMLRARRAYAKSLSDWRVNETASSVDGFDSYIEPLPMEELESMIQELK